MSVKLDYCYHTHTFRCGHAHGLDEEYVLEAKKIGLKHLGFSDHVILPGFNQPGIRGKMLYLNDYIYVINNFKKKYEGDIDIKLGFECEWYEGRFKDYYTDLLKNKGFDYLILGEHCRFTEKDEFAWYGLRDSVVDVLAYADSVVDAIKSGLFLYVAHADHFMIWYHKFDAFAEEACKRIAEASVKYNVPLEINLGSLRRDALNPGHEDEDVAYPKIDCWRIFAKYGAKCVIGYDVHNPSEFEYSLKHNIAYVNDFIDKLGLKFVSNDELWSKKIKE